MPVPWNEIKEIIYKHKDSYNTFPERRVIVPQNSLEAWKTDKVAQTDVSVEDTPTYHAQHVRKSNETD